MFFDDNIYHPDKSIEVEVEIEIFVYRDNILIIIVQICD